MQAISHCPSLLLQVTNLVLVSVYFQLSSSEYSCTNLSESLTTEFGTISCWFVNRQKIRLMIERLLRGTCQLSKSISDTGAYADCIAPLDAIPRDWMSSPANVTSSSHRAWGRPMLRREPVRPAKTEFLLSPSVGTHLER